ncbi:MAG TPA: MraY family glycosyltransferase [Candidatus Solibacter sp.]|nr:MraY family glycosyltransferase [Candidatus Solibacter sp.]
MLGAVNPADNPLSPEFYRILSHNFKPTIAPLLVAMAVTVVLFPLVRWLSFRVGAVAVPGGRNIHDRPTGRLGGVALAAGFLVSATAFVLLGSGTRHDGFAQSQVIVLLGVGALTTAVLVVDDIRQLPARYKFVSQLVLAVLVPALGVSIHFINFGGGHVLTLGILALPITVVWLLGMQNTMNLLDGVDGLAAGVAAIVAGALMLAAVNRESSNPEQLTVVLLCAALIGACLGFLVFNFHPARIFMGDGGSHFLGMTLGIISIFGIAKGEVVFALLVPLFALLTPIFDTGLAIIRRRRQGLSIGHPDTEHIHHQLLDFGLSQRETCLIFYAATGITSGLGLMLYGHKKIIAVAVVLLVVVVSTMLGERLSEIETGVAGDSGALLES